MPSKTKLTESAKQDVVRTSRAGNVMTLVTFKEDVSNLEGGLSDCGAEALGRTGGNVFSKAGDADSSKSLMTLYKARMMFG